MPGRNDRCPCGSGRKYKKCCLEKAESGSRELARGHAPSNSHQSLSGGISRDRAEPVTFASLAACEGIDKLPLLALSRSSQGMNGRMRELKTFLDHTPVIGSDFKLLPSDCRCLEVVFEVDSQKKPDSYALDDDDDYDDYDDEYYDSDMAEVQVTFTEESPDGPIAISVDYDGEALELKKAQTEIDAAMVLAWMACSAHGNRRQQPAFIGELHRKFQSMGNLREKRAKGRLKIEEEVSKNHLESLTVVLPSRLADGSDFRNHFPQGLQPAKAFADVLPLDKLTHPDPEVTDLLNWKSAKFTKAGLPEIFTRPLAEVKGYPILLQVAARASESIIYHFSNGVAVNAREILNHPFAVLIPPDILPGGVTLPGAVKSWSKTFAKAELTNGELTETEMKKYLLIRGAGRWVPWADSTSFCDKPIAVIFRHAISRLNRGELKLFFALAESEPGDHSFSFRSHREADLLPFVGSARDKRSTLSRLPIFGIEVDEVAPLKWSIQFGSRALAFDPSLHTVTAEVRLAPAEGAARKILSLQNGALDLEQRKLHLKPLAEEVEVVSRFARGPDEREAPDSQGVRVQIDAATTYSLALFARGFSAVSELFAELKRENYLGYRHDERRTLNLTARPEIHLARDGSFTLVRRLASVSDLNSNDSNDSNNSNEPINSNESSSSTPFEEAKSLALPFLYGFSPQVLRLIRMLAEGLPSYFGTEAKEMASRNKRVRDFELKLLKHQGIVNLLLYETLAVRYRGAMSDGVIAKTPVLLLELLEGKILALMGEEEPAAKKLLNYCSKTIYGKLLKLVSDFFKIHSDEVFLTFVPEGEAEVKGFLDDELRLIFSLLEHAVLSSNGEIFARPRFNLAQQILPLVPPSVLPLGGRGEDSQIRGLQVFLASERRPTEAVDGLASSLNQSHHQSGDQGRYLLRLPDAGKTVAGRSTGQTLQRTLVALQPLAGKGFEFYFNGRRLKELDENEFKTELDLLDEAKPRSVDVALDHGRLDWFELHPKFFLHGVELQAAEAQGLLRDGMIEHGGQYYLIPAARLPSLRKLSDFWLRLQQGKNGTSVTRANGQPIYQVAKSQVLEILALRSSGIQVQGGNRWKEICSFYDGLNQRNQPNQSKHAFSLPTTVHGILKSYQEIGVQRIYDLYRLGLGAILADDMGLGKTLQALAMLEKLREERRLGHTLIIVPTSLTYNWLSEREKFTPELPMISFSAKTKEAVGDFLQQRSEGVVLTTYGLLQEHKEFFQQVKWNVAIFDEAQNLKNITAQRTTTARALTVNVKICLTGTPLENHLGEFYSLLDLVVPGCLGDFDQFQKTYVNAPSIVFEDIEYLKLKSRPLILRRTKREILIELPEKQESRVVLPFEEKQKKIYRDIAISYNEKIRQAVADGGESKCQLQMLTALLRLRQACSSPGGLPGVKYTQTPPKIEALLESLSEIVESGESALVFTQFLHTLEGVTSALRKAKIPVFELHGALTRDRREEALREFHAVASGAVLVMTLKTGGVGLNLTKASYVFHLEPWWNPAVENQATDRAHRLGQARAVQVYRYIMHDSVEEKIERLKGQKQQRFDVMFSEAESSTDDGESLDHREPKAKGRMASQASHLSQADFNFLLQGST